MNAANGSSSDEYYTKSKINDTMYSKFFANFSSTVNDSHSNMNMINKRVNNNIDSNDNSILINDSIKSKLKVDIKKVFDLLKSIDSRSSKNFCDLLQLCAGIGEHEILYDILLYVKNKNILLPYKNVTESMLFSYFQNSDFKNGLFFGLEVLRRNEFLHRTDNDNDNNNNNINNNINHKINDNNSNDNINNNDNDGSTYDYEFDSEERKLNRIQNLKIENEIKNLLHKKIFPSKKFYYILFSISAHLGTSEKSIDLYEYYEKSITYQESEKNKKEINSNNNEYYNKNIQIKRLEDDRIFSHTLQVLVVDSFMRSNSIFDGQCWALDRIVDNVKKIKIYDSKIRRIQENNKHINKIKGQIDIESSDLLLPILKIYLNNNELNEIKKLLLDLKDLNIPSNITLNCELILHLSGNGAIEPTLELIKSIHKDKNVSIREKLSLWEAALGGCIYENYSNLPYNENYQSTLFKKISRVKKNKILPKAKAEQVQN